MTLRLSTRPRGCSWWHRNTVRAAELSRSQKRQLAHPLSIRTPRALCRTVYCGLRRGRGGGGNIEREPKRGRFAGLRRARRTLSVQSSVGSPVAGRPSVDAYGSKMDESDADSTGSETRHRVTGEIVSRPAGLIERSRMDQIERHAPAGSELLTSRTPSWRAKSEKAWGIWQQSRRLS